MATFYQANVTATNGSAFVEVNSSGDDIGILRERSFLQIGTNRIVEVKAGIPGSPDQIELAAVWPFATVTADAIAGPTAGDLADAVAQIRTLNQQAADILADAMKKSDNLAGLANLVTARGNLGLGDAAVKTVMSSLTDTTAGRLMPVGAFGLGGDLTGTDLGTITDIANLSTYIQEGVGGQLGGLTFSGVSGVPDGLYSVVNWPRSSRGIVFFHNNSDNEIYYTNKLSSGWQPVKKLYSTGNILGTVSQSGGVPTGAIIERGSNANGEYVVFADGTMHTEGSRTLATNVANAAGSLYQSGNLSITLPAAYPGGDFFFDVKKFSGAGSLVNVFAATNLNPLGDSIGFRLVSWGANTDGSVPVRFLTSGKAF